MSLMSKKKRSSCVPKNPKKLILGVQEVARQVYLLERILLLKKDDTKLALKQAQLLRSAFEKLQQRFITDHLSHGRGVKIRIRKNLVPRA